MEEKTSFILTIILGLIIVGGVFGLGYFIGKRGVEVKPQTQVRPSSLLDSKMLYNWITFAKGEVKEISGRDLILSSNGETLKISISEKAVIQSLNLETKEIKKANFEDIKIGDRVEIQSTVKPEEKILIGNLITIIP